MQISGSSLYMHRVQSAAALVAECEKPSASIRAAYRPDAGALWNAALEISGSGSGNTPRVGIDANGNAAAVWASPGPSSAVIASYRPAAGGWSAGAQISPIGKVTLNPNLAMSAGGYAHAIWREERNEYSGDPVIEVKASRRSPGSAGTWNTPFRLSANFGPSSTTPVASGEPQIEIGANSQRMMAWSQLGTKEVMVERTSGGDLFGINEPPLFISEAGNNVEVPQIAVDGTGLGIATWRSDEAGAFPVKAATTSLINGSWSSPTTLSGPTSVGTEPTVAADPAGDATVVWNAGSNVSAASRAAGGGFTPTTVISSPSQSGFERPLVEMTAEGDALVVWPSGANHVALAVNDATPPAIAALSIPAAIEAGAPAPMSATATDTWSPVSLSWDFGDGGSGSEASIAHTYATAGTRTVTVTANDAAGNSAGLTRSIEVTPGSGTGPSSAPSPSPSLSPSPRRKVMLTVKVPKQDGKAIESAGAIKLRCRLDVVDRCAAKATVTASVAKRIGLPVPGKAKIVNVGSGSAGASAGRFAVVKLKLTRKALAAVDEAAKDFPVALAVTGSATGHDSAAVKKKLVVRLVG
ncbi:MAG TPA: PKD domain-containing protein [Solirubrobacterales bacterium]|nr:PKD domain-containing protein [Solirubrobacterales bacterium]